MAVAMVSTNVRSVMTSPMGVLQFRGRPVMGAPGP